MTDEPRRAHRTPIQPSVQTRSVVNYGQKYGPPWTPNWIDHRSSRANVHRRINRGQIPPTCAGCGCETDVAPTPHSPNCKTPA